jgi:uracil phosphoribosyltransferase
MSVLRDKTTATVQFRGALEQIAILLVTEASKHRPTLATEFETPLARMTGGDPGTAGGVRANLRAGLGLLEGMLCVVPKAEIGNIGLDCDEVTLQPVNYYCRLPAGLAQSYILLLDPMLATDRSATAATLLKSHGATSFNLFAWLPARNRN